jgi:hypothetical protein
MPRHIAFATGFLGTCAIVIPIAWHHLDASIERDGKHVRPLQQELTIDGSRVTLDVDHNLIANGDSVIAKLHAYSDKPKQIAVDIAVYYSDDQWGSRVASPPRAIDLEHLVVAAGPDGGKGTETRLTLKGKGQVNTFKIFAMSGGHKLESAYDDDGETVAAVPVLAWSGNSYELSIKPEGKIVAGQPFVVRVHAKDHNKAPYIELGTSIALAGVADSDDWEVKEIDQDETRSYRRYQVTPKNADLKEITLIASAYEWDSEGISPITGGAMDAKTFRIEPASTKVAEK